MAAGQSNKKVACIIQARMQSARLPGKILLPLPLASGKPLLRWIIDELKNSVYKPDIVVATSGKPENDVLVPFCEKNEIKIFRGEEDDVLSRFTSIARQQNYDCIVRLTADNPIIDIGVLDDTLAFHFNNGNNYTRTEGLPVGMNFEVIEKTTLLDIENHQITEADREHVTLYVKNSGKYSLGVYKPAIDPVFKTLRLTVDYASDYALMSSILVQSIADDGLKGLDLVEKTYHAYPWLFESNAGNIQKVQFADEKEELKAAITFLKQFDFNRAAGLLAKV